MNRMRTVRGTRRARRARTQTPPGRRRALALTSTAGLLAGLALTAGCSDEPDQQSDGDRPDDPGTVTATLDTEAPDTAQPNTVNTPGPRDVKVTDTLATGLDTPWGIAFLPDGDALVTQRDTGTISRLTPQGKLTEVGTIEQTAPTSEGGLLGIAVSPDFAQDGQVFVYVTTSDDNEVLRMSYDGRRTSDIEPILTGIPVGSIHDGGRLAFGPDGFLYVSTGETGNEELAQDKDSLGGKILRIRTDGDPAPGNPFEGSPIWTLGHRNVQGLAFDDKDRLWASEFGNDTWDEVNLIQAGKNYGWPVAEGDANLEGYVDPYVQWRPEDASPSSVAFADGALWVASLRGSRLWEVPVEDDGTLGTPVPHFVGEYGRLRAVTAAPDGSLWLGTSNQDGRGFPADNDDRIFHVSIS
jgi:glucose/arabinose dehydrogenase